MTKKYDILFTPCKIGKMDMKNRIIMGPMGGTRLLENSKFNQTAADYLVQCAKGGVGLIITGVTYVQDIKGYEYGIWQDAEEFIPNTKKLMEKIHAEGCRLFVQLGSGRGRTLHSNAKLPGPDGPVNMEKALIAPSYLPNVWKPELMHRTMTREEIHTLVSNFGKAAKMVKDAGVDGIEIHAVHEGYLLDQFTIEATNHRTDEYGGSLENRMRLAREIIDEIRKYCGEDFPVIMRYSVVSKMKGFNSGALPGEAYTEFGRSLDESPKVARMLENMGYDALDADNGSYDAWYWAHPPVYMPKACNLPEISYIKKYVNIPVLCGGRVGYPDIASEIIRQEKADAIVVARQFLTDPDWIRKLESENIKDIRFCIACQNGCIGDVYNKPLCCSINPAAMQDDDSKLKPGSGKKKIVIIGGGIGGMEAARVCRLRGYEAVIFEKSNALGGVFIAASSPYYKEEDRQLIEWYKRQLDTLAADVRFNTVATPELVAAEKPDSIIVAIGAKARRLPVKGADGENTVYAADFLLSNNRAGNKIVVIGGGLTGCEIAFELGEKGKDVTLVEMLPDILNVPGLCHANSSMLRELLIYHNVKVMVSANVREITPVSVIVETDGETRELPAEQVIISIGYIPDASLEKELQHIAKVHIIGDCRKVTNLSGPIWDAYQTANSL